MNEDASAAPEWFRRAVAVARDDREVIVEGCRIHYCVWGKQNKPGLLFVHGSGAHSHWWDFIAPYFLEHNHVAAIDLSGMGDSGHRSGYSTEIFAHEVVAVCEHAGFERNAVLVGHSFGGFVTAKAGLLAGDRIAGVVLADAPVRPPDYDWEHDPKKSPIQRKKIYPEIDLALSRFRLVPAQPCENQFILDYIARHSLAKVNGGWSWKFDDQLFDGFKIGDTSADLFNLRCRVGVIYGDNSQLVSQDVADYMFKVLDRSVPFIAIPEANHHLFLDQPLAFISALRAVLAEWRHSKPQRGGHTS
jgi:pimeloyl-ACP methyl ester carboxylesterase